MKTRTWWLIAAALLAAPALSAQAWIITQVEPSPSAGYSVGTVVPYATEPGLDIFEIHKYFIRDPNDAQFPLPLVLQFVRQPGDQNTIDLVDEMILNLMTGQNITWDDFHVALLTEPNVLIRGGLVEWVNPGGARAWQQTGGASRLGGDPATVSAVQIDWWDGNEPVPPGAWADAPANQLVLRGLRIDVSDVGVGEGFLLKEWPTIPEPGTLVLVAGGAASLLLRRRKR
jgi:hypothetical protein